MDPCETYVKSAKKHDKIFGKNLWTAGLFYLNAAECYKNSDNTKKAFEYANKAVKLLEKYWNKINDMVLPDLEKALSLAVLLAPNKKKREELKRMAFEVYMYHARKLELSGNYMGASEKYEAAIQFAPSGEAAKNALLKAIAVVEKALDNPNIIKKSSLAEKFEERLEYLKSLLPEEEPESIKEESKSEQITSALSLYSELECVPGAVETSIQEIQNTFGKRITDFSIRKNEEYIEVTFSIPGYSAFVELKCARGYCDLNIYSSNIEFIAEIYANILYTLKKNGALRGYKTGKIKGNYLGKDLIGFIRKIKRLVKAREEARKLSTYLAVLSELARETEDLSKFVDDLDEIVRDLEEMYVFGASILPTDIGRINNKLAEILVRIGGS